MHKRNRSCSGKDAVALYLAGEVAPPWVTVDAATYLAVKDGYLSGETIEALALRCEVSSRTILRWAARDTWPKGRDNRAHTTAIRRRAHELWLAGRTYAQIQQTLGVSSSTIYRWRQSYGWPPRRES